MNDPGLLFTDLVRCETRLYNALDDALRAGHEISAVVFELLRFLRDRPGSRVADIAAEFAIGVGAASKGIDRYERQGWVVRTPNPADRRSSLLALTEPGRELVRAAEQTFATCVSGLLDSALSPAQQAATARALEVLRAALERERVGLPTG